MCTAILFVIWVVFIERKSKLAYNSSITNMISFYHLSVLLIDLHSKLPRGETQ